MRCLPDHEGFLSAEENNALLQEVAKSSLRLRASQSIASKWIVWVIGFVTVLVLSDVLPWVNLMAWALPIVLMAEVNWQVCRRVLSDLDKASSAQIRQKQWWLWWMTVINQICVGSTVWWLGAEGDLSLAAAGTLLQLVYLGAAMTNAATHPLTFVTGAWLNLLAVIGFWATHGNMAVPVSLGLSGTGLMLLKLSKQMAFRLRQSIELGFEKQALLDKLVEEKKLTDEAMRVKSDFLSNISHEIRTPLGAIMGVTHLLAESSMNAQQRGQVRVIDQCSRHLHELVNQVLDFSKLEAGMMQLRHEPFSLSAVLSNVQLMHEDMALVKGLSMKFDIAPQIPDQLMGDPLRLTEVLVNFLGNAIKFTEQGSVELSVEPQEVQAQAQAQEFAPQHWVCLCFSVRDTGIGVDPAQVDRLFESFSQADTSSTRHYGGTGLGLSISKNLVKLMGGRVGVESQLGRGSRFWCQVCFELPAPKTSDAPIPLLAGRMVQAPAPKLVLDLTLRRKEVLPEGARTYATSYVCSKLAYLLATDDPSAVQWLEQHEQVLTHDLDASFHTLAYAIRHFDFVKAVQLLAHLGYKATGLETAFELDAKADAHSVAPLILVVDDTAVNLSLMVDLLKKKYRLKVATSGERALSITAQNPKLDLILLDIMMPKMDGFETITKLKQQTQHTQTADIPVIFLTAKNQLEDEAQGLKLGAVDFITKPINPPIVLERIRTQLALKAARDFLKNKSDYLQQEVLRRTAEITQIQAITILTVASLAETRDNETGQHILRTQRYVKALAEALKNHPKFQTYLNNDQINLLFLSAPLHDIGKVGIPDRILLKPDRLTPEEMEIMKSHTTIGRDSIESAERRLGQPVPFLVCAKEIAYSHQEKWDGSGYPQGLKHEAIPISARLMAVADVYDALISRRVYKPPMPHEQAVQMMLAQRGKHFDPDVTDAFARIHEQFREIAIAHADADTNAHPNEAVNLLKV